jgi:DNA polymerase elongation subunit (family B)
MIGEIVSKKIRNFGDVTYNSLKHRIEYSWFEKNSSGEWEEKHDQQTLRNTSYIPNTEAVINTRLGKKGSLDRDIWGNEILIPVVSDFYDKNPPLSLQNAKKVFSSDIKPTVKFLAENFEFDTEKDEIPPLRIIYLDIETIINDKGFLDGWSANCSRGGIQLITCYNVAKNKTTTFGTKPYSGENTDEFQYVLCDDEKKLLKNFILYLKKYDPHIISGWNVAFDISFILNRMLYTFGDKALNHFGNGSAWIKNEAKKYIIRGISIIDYMTIYKKFELSPRRSYSLSNIADEEGIKIDGQGKHEYEGTMKNFYETQWDKFVLYNIQDTKLVYEIDNKKKLMNTFILLCYMSGLPFSDAMPQDFSWLRVHDASIYRYCEERGLKIPDGPKRGEILEDTTITGAYVKEPIPGIYEYVTIFDVTSLYPSCIRSINISSDTFRGKILNREFEGKVFNGNDFLFDESFSILPGKLTVELYDELNLSLGSSEREILSESAEYLKKKVDIDTCRTKILTFNNSREFSEFLKDRNFSLAANGTIYTKGAKGIIPALLDTWFEDRKKNKKIYFEYKKKFQETKEEKYKILAERYNIIQNIQKIKMNSIYGILAMKYFRFFNIDLAEAITITGQHLNKAVAHQINLINPLYEIIYMDTDSVLVNYGKILKYEGFDLKNKESCVKRCLEIDEEIKTMLEKYISSITNDKLSSMNYFKYETEEVCERMLITSKKKYACKILYDKTTKEWLKDSYVFKGLECKKSSYSKTIRELLKNITIKIMGGLTEEEILTLFKEIWMKIPEYPIDDIAYAQGVENIYKYGPQSNICIKNAREAIADFPKGCPYHVIGSLALNALIDWDKDLQDMTKIVSGDKGKIIFVCPNNMMGIEAIVYTGKWNPKLYQYFKLDVEKIFLRLILQPLQPVLDAVKFKFTLDSILGFKFTDSCNTYKQELLF